MTAETTHIQCVFSPGWVMSSTPTNFLGLILCKSLNSFPISLDILFSACALSSIVISCLPSIPRNTSCVLFPSRRWASGTGTGPSSCGAHFLLYLSFTLCLAPLPKRIRCNKTWSTILMSKTTARTMPKGHFAFLSAQPFFSSSLTPIYYTLGAGLALGQPQPAAFYISLMLLL